MKYKWILYGQFIYTDEASISLDLNGMQLIIHTQEQLNSLGIGDNKTIGIRIFNEDFCDEISGGYNDDSPRTIKIENLDQVGITITDKSKFEYESNMKAPAPFLHDHPHLKSQLDNAKDYASHIIVDKEDWEKTVNFLYKHPEIQSVIEGKALEEYGKNLFRLADNEEVLAALRTWASYTQPFYVEELRKALNQFNLDIFKKE